MIDPNEVIKQLEVEALCAKAEQYFRNVVDPTPLMSKPFMNLLEAPTMLSHLGLLLSGLKLAKTMTVLDFGAGTCWLSRFLNQLQCATISLDPSLTALQIGKKLFAEYPIVGAPIADPQFLHFDGHQIQLPDESVDRIICFDTFHHVPNQQEVLGELARVLKTGGISGFSEPGRRHSQSPQAQYEMRNYQVLENDIKPEEIWTLAREKGFSHFSCKLLCNQDLDFSITEYQKMVRSKFTPPVSLSFKFWQSLYSAMHTTNIFFLYKGTYVPDSRTHLGLAHTLRVEADHYVTRPNVPVNIPVAIENTGIAKWLSANMADIGVVKLGVHLYNQENTLLDLDFWKKSLGKPVLPGETITLMAEILFPLPGQYHVVLDLVSENICWFENVGSTPVCVHVTVH
jgi:ubiquinone/menaquinone biosynthesis C-methylase UbiE